jgi:hypothetical protein
LHQPAQITLFKPGSLLNPSILPAVAAMLAIALVLTVAAMLAIARGHSGKVKIAQLEKR